MGRAETITGQPQLSTIWRFILTQWNPKIRLHIYPTMPQTHVNVVRGYFMLCYFKVLYSVSKMSHDLFVVGKLFLPKIDDWNLTWCGSLILTYSWKLGCSVYRTVQFYHTIFIYNSCYSLDIYQTLVNKSVAIFHCKYVYSAIHSSSNNKTNFRFVTK